MFITDLQKENLRYSVFCRGLGQRVSRMRDEPFFASGMRGRKKFKGEMQDCKRLTRGGKLVISVVGRGNFGLE